MSNVEVTNKWIGARTIRPDGAEKVTGAAQFAADYSMPGAIWGRVTNRKAFHRLA